MAVYDVFSIAIGVVMAELILGCLNLDQRRNRDERVDVREIEGADPIITWKPDVLESICKTAIGSMSYSPRTRLGIHKLI